MRPSRRVASIPVETVTSVASKVPERRTPWVLALVVFPVVGATLWASLVWFDDSDPFEPLFDVGVRNSPALALPALLTFAATRARRAETGLSISLVIGSAVCTFVYAAGPVVAVAFSGVG